MVLPLRRQQTVGEQLIAAANQREEQTHAAKWMDPFLSALTAPAVNSCAATARKERTYTAKCEQKEGKDFFPFHHQ